MLTRRGENGPVANRPGGRLCSFASLRRAADQLGRAALSNDVEVSGPGEGNGRGAREPREGSSGCSQSAAYAPPAGEPAACRGAQQRRRRRGDRSCQRQRQRATQRPAQERETGRDRRHAPADQPAAKAQSQDGAPAAAPEAVPRQGYESVEERATGPVQPPGDAEFIGTAAEIVTELAKAGISGAERLVRDVLSRLGR